MRDRRRMKRVSSDVLEFDPEFIGRLSAEAEKKLAEHPGESRSVLRAMKACWSEVLTPIQRLYLDEYYKERMTMKQIGEKHGVTVATVSRTLKRARNRLRAVLKYYI